MLCIEVASTATKSLSMTWKRSWIDLHRYCGNAVIYPNLPAQDNRRPARNSVPRFASRVHGAQGCGYPPLSPTSVALITGSRRFFVGIIDAGNTRDRNAEIEGMKTIRTDGGNTVNRIEKGKYQIVATGQILRSSDPDAP
jgi:hypothetical protein